MTTDHEEADLIERDLAGAASTAMTRAEIAGAQQRLMELANISLSEPVQPPVINPTAIVLWEVAREREHQVRDNYFTSGHDDQWTRGELVHAACCYAGMSLDVWPWPEEWFKSKGYRQDLIRALGLLVAEVERYDRAEDKRKTLPDGFTRNHPIAMDESLAFVDSMTGTPDHIGEMVPVTSYRYRISEWATAWKQRRISRRISLIDVAKHIGLPLGTISAVERGEYDLSSERKAEFDAALAGDA